MRIPSDLSLRTREGATIEASRCLAISGEGKGHTLLGLRLKPIAEHPYEQLTAGNEERIAQQWIGLAINGRAQLHDIRSRGGGLELAEGHLSKRPGSEINKSQVSSSSTMTPTSTILDWKPKPKGCSD